MGPPGGGGGGGLTLLVALVDLLGFTRYLLSRQSLTHIEITVLCCW